MIIDALRLDSGRTFDCDLCILGSGPAGISVALAAEAPGRRIVVLEAGGASLSEESQEFYRGDCRGTAYPELHQARTRCFGGTSSWWAGACAPLDEEDFVAHPWRPHTGWPIPRTAVLPFYVEAHRVLRLGEGSFDAGDWTTPDAPAMKLPPDAVDAKLWKFNPLRFATAYHRHLDSSSSITVVLNAAAVAATFDGEYRHLAAVTARNTAQPRLTVRARAYVLAAGGIENARLLLTWARPGLTVGPGNPNVGRYFVDHPHISRVADLALYEGRANARFYTKHEVAGTVVQGLLRLHRRERERLGLPNVAFKLARRASQGPSGGDATPHALHLLRSVDRFAQSVDGDPRVLALLMMCEQRPSARNRVTLGHDRDPFGVPRARLDLTVGADELASYERTLLRMVGILGASALARARLTRAAEVSDWRSVIRWGCHHLGTTRMSHDAVGGVVDTDCRVHGVDNLYVAGSSVFSTGGAANPTLTIVALALRLGAHLRAAVP